MLAIFISKIKKMKMIMRSKIANSYYGNRPGSKMDAHSAHPSEVYLFKLPLG